MECIDLPPIHLHHQLFPRLQHTDKLPKHFLVNIFQLGGVNRVVEAAMSGQHVDKIVLETSNELSEVLLR